MNNRSTIVINRGASSLSLLQIAFIVLKLTNVIAWSWLWVLSPFWISLTISIVLIAIYMICLKRIARQINQDFKKTLIEIKEKSSKEINQISDDNKVVKSKEEVKPNGKRQIKKSKKENE